MGDSVLTVKMQVCERYVITDMLQQRLSSSKILLESRALFVYNLMTMRRRAVCPRARAKSLTL
jgi:hypothetical protein